MRHSSSHFIHIQDGDDNLLGKKGANNNKSIKSCLCRCVKKNGVTIALFLVSLALGLWTMMIKMSALDDRMGAMGIRLEIAERRVKDMEKEMDGRVTIINEKLLNLNQTAAEVTKQMIVLQETIETLNLTSLETMISSIAAAASKTSKDLQG